MRKPIKIIHLCLLAVICLLNSAIGAPAFAGTSFRNDSLTSSKQRSFDKASLRQYREDPDFNYLQEDLSPSKNQYESNALAKLLKKLFGISFNQQTAVIWELLIYILCGGILLFALYHIVRADKSWFIHKNTKKAPLTYEREESNIHEMDIDELIRQALAQKQYRKVVRLMYLKTLKELNNKNLIEWSVQKTNSDYINELKAGSLKEAFRQNTIIFEYIWYGDFQIDEVQLQQVKNSFDHFITQLNNR